MKFLITGGAGFIGSALIRHLINHTQHDVLNIDKLTYAGSLESLRGVSESNRYHFREVDICSMDAITHIFETYQPDIVMHLAAESHVDRSIDSSAAFIQTNIVGTYVLLDVARSYIQKLPQDRAELFRFHHISTDEVYGDLTENDHAFTETRSYAPSSPYSASKASSDHLVRAWHRTYGLPVIVTNCSNNYGPYQFPEKLIPLTILNALAGKPITVYGSGLQIRDWLYVDDHVRALCLVVEKGTVGETYNIGGHNERTNLSVIHTVCSLLEELGLSQLSGGRRYTDLITYIKDRPGHDQRYAIDAKKINDELSWSPQETVESGMRKTVQWYIEHLDWVNLVKEKKDDCVPVYLTECVV